MLAVVTACNTTDITTVDRIYHLFYEFHNDTEFQCRINWDDTSISIEPGGTHTQLQHYGIGVDSAIQADGSSRPIIFVVGAEIVFGDERDFVFTSTDGFSWLSLPKTEEQIGVPRQYCTTYRYYMSDILDMAH